MTFRELTDYAKIKFNGNIAYGGLGRLSKAYKIAFIKECIDKFPENRRLTSSGNIAYLTTLCRKHAEYEDFVRVNKIDLPNMGMD